MKFRTVLSDSDIERMEKGKGPYGEKILPH